MADGSIAHGANELLELSRYRHPRLHPRHRLRRRHRHLRHRLRRFPVSTGTTIGGSTVREAGGITTAPPGLAWTNSG